MVEYYAITVWTSCTFYNTHRVGARGSYKNAPVSKYMACAWSSKTGSAVMRLGYKSAMYACFNKNLQTRTNYKVPTDKIQETFYDSYIKNYIRPDTDLSIKIQMHPQQNDSKIQNNQQIQNFGIAPQVMSIEISKTTKIEKTKNILIKPVLNKHVAYEYKTIEKPQKNFTYQNIDKQSRNLQQRCFETHVFAMPIKSIHQIQTQTQTVERYAPINSNATPIIENKKEQIIAKIEKWIQNKNLPQTTKPVAMPRPKINIQSTTKVLKLKEHIQQVNEPKYCISKISKVNKAPQNNLVINQNRDKINDKQMNKTKTEDKFAYKLTTKKTTQITIKNYDIDRVVDKVLEKLDSLEKKCDAKKVIEYTIAYMKEKKHALEKDNARLWKILWARIEDKLVMIIIDETSKMIINCEVIAKFQINTIKNALNKTIEQYGTPKTVINYEQILFCTKDITNKFKMLEPYLRTKGIEYIASIIQEGNTFVNTCALLTKINRTCAQDTKIKRIINSYNLQVVMQPSLFGLES